MRITAFTALILAAGIGAGAAQGSPATLNTLPDGWAQAGLSPGQAWVVQQENLAVASQYRMSGLSAQLAQQRAMRPGQPGRPQRHQR